MASRLIVLITRQAPERYGTREGGYCRVLRTLNRQGDNSKMGARPRLQISSNAIPFDLNHLLVIVGVGVGLQERHVEPSA